MTLQNLPLSWAKNFKQKKATGYFFKRKKEMPYFVWVLFFSCRGLIHQTHLFKCTNKLTDFVLLMSTFDSCRGLIHQAHLFKCTNKLTDFVLLMSTFDSCRGLIHQAHLFKCTNKLMDFDLLMFAFDSCRGLIYQAHLMLNLEKRNIIRY